MRYIQWPLPIVAITVRRFGFSSPMWYIQWPLPILAIPVRPFGFSSPMWYIKWPLPILAIPVRPFGFSSPKDFSVILTLQSFILSVLVLVDVDPVNIGVRILSRFYIRINDKIERPIIIRPVQLPSVYLLGQYGNHHVIILYY